MKEDKKQEIKSLVEKLMKLDETGIKVIKIKTDALYDRQLLDEKQTA